MTDLCVWMVAHGPAALCDLGASLGIKIWEEFVCMNMICMNLGITACENLCMKVSMKLCMKLA